MASKIQVAKFHDFSEGPMLDPTSSGVWNMEENDVVGQLKDESFKKRVEILEQLIITVKRNGGRLPYSDHESIFRGLGLALSDTNWEIRLKCIVLLQELIPSLQDDLDHCMSLVLSKLISNIGDSKVTLRKAVISNLHRYMKHTKNLPALLHAIVNTGLENEDARVRRETISALPMLLTKEFITANLSWVIQSLAKKLLDTSAEDNLKDVSLTTLQSIEKLLGPEQFDVYVQRLSPSLKKYYLQLTGKLDNGFSRETQNSSQGMYTARQSVVQGGRDRRDMYMDGLEFGIIPTHIMSRINDQKDFKTRAQAVEDLKGVILELSSPEINQKLTPHMMPFLSFLSSLLDDSNFKIITVTLEILYSVVERLGTHVKNYVKNIVNALSKRMGDNKVVIRQSIMRVLIKMMQCDTPQHVLSVLFDNLSHRNSRVRQETINFIIAALLTFPSYEFDLPNICLVVGPTLTDVKRQVRQSALECFAVLAQAMGSGRLQPLVQAVDQVELSSEGEGLMAAVQARLARRQLPRLNGEGLVEYATPFPTSATQRSSSSSQSADTEWILAVGGSSARTARSDIMELESVTSSSARTTPGTESNAPTPAPRRFMSAGRGRNRLPWEEDRDERSRFYEDLPNSAPAHRRSAPHVQGITEDPAPPKPRAMWMGEGEGGSPDLRSTPKRKTTLDSLGLVVQNEDTDSIGGSYSKIYTQKRQRQLAAGSRTNSFNGTVDLHDFARDTKENGYVRSDQRTPRTVLDPISADAAKPIDDPNKQDEDESPIPLKATIARGATTHRSSAKVPPIALSSDRSANHHDDDTDSAYSISTSSNHSRADSLRGIRNSAKNKVQRLFDRIEKQESRQSLASPTGSEQVEESGIFSTGTAATFTSVRSKKTDAVETKSKAQSHRASLAHKRNSVDNNDNLDINENKHNTIHLDYNPNSGVTFRENRNADVQVVGRGYSDDSSSLFETTRSTQPNVRARDRRRANKGSILSPLGGPASHSTFPQSSSVQIAPDSEKAGGEEEKEGKAKPIPRDKIALVGRGMFESAASVSEYPVSSSGMAEKGERRRMDTNRAAAPPGVVGIAVRSTADMSHADSESTNTGDDDSEDDAVSLAKSTSFQRSIADKQRKKKEQEERLKMERDREFEQRQREKDEKLRQEKERQQQKLKKLGSNDSLSVESLSISGSNSSSASNLNATIKAPPPKPAAPAVTLRKTIKTASEPVSSHPMPAMERPPETEAPLEEWKPYNDPEGSLRAAHKKLESDDWEMKTEGLGMLRRIVHFHQQLFVPPQLHPVILAVVNEVKNLRSQVSRLAIVCLADMFMALKKSMDTDLDIVTRQLLVKAGESNNFIREDVEQALNAMVEGVTPQRSLSALIAGGATHKNQAVRKTTAQFLVRVVERMGSGKILSGVKDVTDRVLPTAAQLVMDSSPETRYNGRKILYLLMSHGDFDRMLTKYLPANTLRNIQDVVENLKNKGLGDKPNETSSARSRRSGHGSRMGSSLRGNSAHSHPDGISSNTPPARKRPARTDEATMEEIKSMINQLSAGDWRIRYDAINTFLDMCVERPEIVSTHIVKIFDKFLPRLQDSNSKVNLHALKVMHQVVPMLKDALQSVISLSVTAIVPNLSSKNAEIKATGTDILESYMEHLDHGMLVQPFANQAQCATGHSKSEMVMKVAYLTDKVYDRKPKQVVLHVLPLLWHLLNGPGVGPGSNELRQATAALASTLYDHMGQGLLDKATSEPTMTAKHINILNELL
ncbi:TOG array regulator of axonemal microtubules protein 1-like isoform X2 [Littorina saxatilis]|uniref:TOG array regulator of axonemal microtubules protein 1-like isoform X2 n=1 Tax=Littorina saxatilis TaxID=31220 RepID=UPI0038B45F28